MKLNLRNQKGFTLVEVTIILLVLVILSTIMLPQLGNFNRLARFVKAREDVGAICATLKKMLDEVMLGGPYEAPRTRAEPVGLLVGPGSIPIDGNEGDGTCGACNADQDLNWQLASGTTGHTMRTDNDGSELDFAVSDLADHLQFNDPDGDGTQTYKNPINDSARTAAGAFFGWRGPYLDELTADPWGNRYMVNTFALHSVPNATPPANVYTSAVVCYSAGPDHGIDTEINQPINEGPAATTGASNFGWQFGQDDVGAILSAGGPF